MLMNRSSTVASLMPLGSQMMSDESINFSSPNEGEERWKETANIAGNARHCVPVDRNLYWLRTPQEVPDCSQPESCHSVMDLVTRFVRPVWLPCVEYSPAAISRHTG